MVWVKITSFMKFSLSSQIMSDLDQNEKTAGEPLNEPIPHLN